MLLQKRISAVLLAMLLLCASACADKFTLINDPLTPDSAGGAFVGSPNVFFVDKDGSMSAHEKASYCPNALTISELSVATVSSNSHVTTTKEDFAPYKVLDNDEATTWQFNLYDVGDVQNAHIDLTLTSPSAVQQVRIKQGFWLIAWGLDQYIRNGRPKDVELTFLYAGSNDFVDPMLFSIPDTRENGYYEMNVGWKQNVTAVRMRICSIIPGDYFEDDVAVSEMRIVGIPMSKWPGDLEAAMAHKTQTKVLEPATCAQSGKELEYCTVCEQVLKEKVIPAGQHLPGDFIDEQFPNCTQSGIACQRCTVCNAVLQEVEIPPFGHIESSPVKKDGIDHVFCVICNEQLR